MGFSQGSMMSMSFLLTRHQRIAGVIAQSGYIPQQSGLVVDEAGVKGKPIIMTHGFEIQVCRSNGHFDRAISSCVTA